MIEYFAFDYKCSENTRYNNMLAKQQITGNDLMQYYTGYNDEYDNNIIYIKRNLLLITAKSNKIIDIRNYENQIAKTDRTINSTAYQRQTYKSKTRTGKTHKKSYSCKAIKNDKLRKKIADRVFQDFDENYNIKKRKDYCNYDRYKFYDMQNNWKSAKVRKQYLWHL